MQPLDIKDHLTTESYSHLIDQESWYSLTKKLAIWALGECAEKIMTIGIEQITNTTVEYAGQNLLSYCGLSSSAVSNQMTELANTQISRLATQTVSQQQLGHQAIHHITKET